MSAKKKVFISDLHMGDEVSMLGCMGATNSRLGCSVDMAARYPYAWLRANVPLVTRFLTAQLKDEHVDEVVILGDLFDGWFVPADIDPALPSSSTPFFELVCDYEVNKPIVQVLKELAAAGKLSYAPGNHDMLVCSQAFLEFKETVFKGMRFWGNQEPGWHRYRASQIVAEHGHDYEPFCAANNWTLRPPYLPSHLSIGFYFSRVVAHKVAVSGKQEDEAAILSMCVAAMLKGLLKDRWDVVQDAFLATAKDAGMDEFDTINMGADVSLPVYVCDIGAIYRTIIQEWDRYNPTQARIKDLVFKGLEECIRRQYFRASRGPRIAICGHTHIPMMKYWRDVRDTPALVKGSVRKPGQTPVSYVYANCGAWADAVRQCTYVETERDPGQNRHYVRLKAYSRAGESTLMQEQFVPLTPQDQEPPAVP